MFDFATAGAAIRGNNKHRDYGSPLSRGRPLVVIEPSPRAAGRIAPALERRPHAAGKPEAVDRRRRSESLEAMQFDAAPLEAAFLQNVARSRIGDSRARGQVLDIEFLEGEIDHRSRRFGAKTLAPILDAQPVAEFRRGRFAPVDADHADRHKVVFDQEYGFGTIVRGGADELDRMVR